MLKSLASHCTLIDCDDCAEGYEYLGSVTETVAAFTRDGWAITEDLCQCGSCAKEWNEDEIKQKAQSAEGIK